MSNLSQLAMLKLLYHKREIPVGTIEASHPDDPGGMGRLKPARFYCFFRNKIFCNKKKQQTHDHTH